MVVQVYVMGRNCRLGAQKCCWVDAPRNRKHTERKQFFFLLLSNTPSVTCPCKHTPPQPPPHYCHHNITIIHTHHKHIYIYHIDTHITKHKNTQPCTHTSPYAQISPHTHTLPHTHTTCTHHIYTNPKYTTITNTDPFTHCSWQSLIGSQLAKQKCSLQNLHFDIM